MVSITVPLGRGVYIGPKAIRVQVAKITPHESGEGYDVELEINLPRTEEVTRDTLPVDVHRQRQEARETRFAD